MSKWPFYRAFDSKVGDVMPCYFNGKFYIYYLRFGVYENGAYNEWSVRETTDFVNFSEDRRVGIFGGTGEIYPLNGKYHLFKEVEPNVIGHYVGDTPYSFEDTGLRLPSDDHYYVPWAWRDPKIFWVEEEKCFWMLVATNEKTNNSVCRHGCVGLCKSKDLYQWEYCPPLYSPLAYDGTYECPDMFKMGNWYYLVYSNANVNKRTHYVKSKNMYGPWIMPEEDTLDSFLFYAGRTASNGENRYVVAWNPERTGEDLAMKLGVRDVDQPPLKQYEDFAPFGYAGDMVMHRLGQKDNGDLKVELIPSIRQQFTEEIPFDFQALQGEQWEVGEMNLTVNSPGKFSCALTHKLPTCYLAEMTVKVNGHEGGIALGADEAFYGRGIFLHIEPKHGRVNVISGLRDRPYVGYCLPFCVEQECFVQPDEQGQYQLQIVQNGELITLYINGQALSLRSANAKDGSLGLFAYAGGLEVSELKVYCCKNSK